jgi:hypothetical protein
MFVRFATDAEGIGYLVRMFDVPGGSRNRFDANTPKELRGGWRMPFSPMMENWQARLGIRLLDPNTVECGLLVNGSWGESSYYVLIDDQNRVAYIYASLD